MDGLRVRLHPLFLSLLVGSLLFGYAVEFGLMFAVVLLHEAGHWLAARLFGWRILELRLLPFGGELLVDADRLARAGEEAIVAVAGPAVNVLLIMCAWMMEQAGWLSERQFGYWIELNVMIGLFNLLPVLPLDGGKIMQALFSKWMSFYRAMLLSRHVSLVGAFVMLLVAVSSQNQSGIRVNLLVISVFLLVTNVLALKRHHLLFVRFLLQKLNAYEQVCEPRCRAGGALARKSQVLLEVSAQASLLQLLKRVKRARRYCFLLRDAGGVNGGTSGGSQVSEHQVLRRFFSTDGRGG